ncbi:MAG: replication protein RepA [Alphaproteobacteria bacterium]
MKEDSLLSKRNIRLIEIAEEIALNGPTDIGFVCRSMVSASMPHSKPIGFQYKRSSNNFTIAIVGNEAAGGIPYGTYPRLILSWLASEIVRTGSREIILGQSLSDFMKRLGLSVTGGRWGTINRFRDQLRKLFAAHISFSYEDRKLGKWIHASMNIADSSQIFWDPKNPNQIDLFKSKVVVGESFFNEILKSPIPVDIRAINALKESSLALDIYFWATYRMSYLSSPIDLSFDKLQMQFGAGYNDTRQGKYEFKRKFLVQLKKVMTLYPKAKISITEGGLKLYPSPSHVSKKSVSSKEYQGV